LNNGSALGQLREQLRGRQQAILQDLIAAANGKNLRIVAVGEGLRQPAALLVIRCQVAGDLDTCLQQAHR
jgi:hypothetical protein